MVFKKNIAILITGTPGTGKTCLAQGFCKKKKWKYISLNDLVLAGKLYSKTDRSDGSKVVKVQTLQTAANREIKKAKKKSPLIIEGHLGCDLKLGVDKVLVLRLHPFEIEKRLAKRNYPKFKLGENMMAETLDYCTINSEKNYGAGKVFEINSTKLGKSALLKKFGEFVCSKNPNAKFKPKIDWTKILEK